MKPISQRRFIGNRMIPHIPSPNEDFQQLLVQDVLHLFRRLIGADAVVEDMFVIVDEHFDAELSESNVLCWDHGKENVFVNWYYLNNEVICYLYIIIFLNVIFN